MRVDIDFCTLDGIRLSAFMYLPEMTEGPFPAIVMSHGYGAVKEMALDQYAESFCKAGFVCLLYDHRNTGASEGTPRGEIDPWQQISDMKDAITFLCARDEIDHERIGLWGTSFSGGHCLVVAATDRRVKCVVSVVPTISGRQNTKRARSSADYRQFVEDLNAERVLRHKRETPRMVPISQAGDESYEWSKVAGAGTTYVNACTFLSLGLRDSYEPGHYIGAISPTPLLLIVADNDTKCLTDVQLAAYSYAHEPKALRLIPGGHYDPYTIQFETVCSASCDWFVSWLT